MDKEKDKLKFQLQQVESLKVALEEAIKETPNWETVQDHAFDVANAITDFESGTWDPGEKEE